MIDIIKKAEIEKVRDYISGLYNSEKNKTTNETKIEIDIDPKLSKLVKKDIRIASEIEIWKHKDKLQSILNKLKEKDKKIELVNIQNSQDCIKTVQIILGITPDGVYGTDTFKAVTKFQYENEDYKNDKCPELEEVKCEGKEYSGGLVDGVLNGRFVDAIERFVNNNNNNNNKEIEETEKQKVNLDLTEEQSREKLKKMTKNPENYFRGSIEIYQGNLNEYNNKLPKLSNIKVPTHGDLHIEQLVLNGTVPNLSDFDESHTNGVITNDLIRILASIKTWGGNDKLQNIFLDTYLSSLNNKKIELQIPKPLSEKLKLNEKQENLADGSNKFINFKDGKFQNFEKEGKVIEIKHIDESQKGNLQKILTEKSINGNIIDGRIDSSNGVGSFGMIKYVVAISKNDKIKFYEFKQQSSKHTAYNVDGKKHKNDERKNVANELNLEVEITEIEGRDFTITEVVPNYNKFPPELIDLKNDTESFSYGVQAIAIELAKLHKSKSNDINKALNDNSEKANLIKCANDFSEKNSKSYIDNGGK